MCFVDCDSLQVFGPHSFFPSHPSSSLQVISFPHAAGDPCYAARVKSCLAEVLLRRTKLDKGPTGLPLLHLPPCSHITELIELLPEERNFYKTLHADVRQEIMYLAHENKLQKSYVQAFSLLLRLRQFCSLPSIILEGMSKAKVASTPAVNRILDRQKHQLQSQAYFRGMGAALRDERPVVASASVREVAACGVDPSLNGGEEKKDGLPAAPSSSSSSSSTSSAAAAAAAAAAMVDDNVEQADASGSGALDSVDEKGELTEGEGDPANWCAICLQVPEVAAKTKRCGHMFCLDWCVLSAPHAFASPHDPFS